MMRRNSRFTLAVGLLLSLTMCSPLPEYTYKNGEESVVDNGGGGNNGGGNNDGGNNGGGNTEPPTPPDPQAVIDRSVVTRYSFDDETARNVAGTTYNGVVFGEAKYISDTPSGEGKALFLNGIKEQLVNIPYNLFKGRSSYSICSWIKDFSTGSLFGGVASDIYGSIPKLYFTGDGHVFFDCIGYNLDYVTPFSYIYTPIQADVWHHIAVTCSYGVLALYIDGQFKDTINKSQSFYSYKYDNLTRVQIGGNGNGLYPVFFSGKLDNVAVYSEALSSNVIDYIYKGRL